MTLRKGRKIFDLYSKEVKTVKSSSNGRVLISNENFSLDYIKNQIEVGFIRLLPSKPDYLIDPKVGTIVSIHKDPGKGVLGFCYSIDLIDGQKWASLFFEDRKNDVFSENQYNQFFEIGFSKEISKYKYENANNFEIDYINGMFSPFLKEKVYVNFF